jgi:protein ImuB
LRVACLLVPDLPAVAELRAHPELAGLPLAVVSEAGPRATVLSVSPAAARAGVQRGSALAQARSVCAELRVRVASPARERTARDALLDAALSASPRAERAPPRAGPRAGEAAVHIDVSSCKRSAQPQAHEGRAQRGKAERSQQLEGERSSSGALFRSEAGLATALATRARALALPAVAAVASSRALAELAARRTAAREGPGATCVIPPGAEAAFLAPLPIDLLDLDDASTERLTRFGIHHCGPLLELCAGPSSRRVAAHLGPELMRLLERLRGEGGEPPIPAPRGARIEESIDLEAPIDNLEPLAFALRGLVARLLARLAIRHLACGELEVELRSGRGRDRRHLALAAPTGDPRIWLRRLRQALESEPPTAPVDFVALAAEGCQARRDQLDLFRPAGPAPAALDALLAELEALCGPERVGAPRVPDDYRPSAFALGPFAPGSAPAAADEAPQPHGPVLAIRALRPPLPAEVRLRAGRPAWLRSAVASGEVLHCAGPWRSSGGWWSEEQRFAFDAFDVATSDGLLVRLRYDRLRRTWAVDALYD